MEKQDKMKKSYGWYAFALAIVGIAVTAMQYLNSRIIAPNVFHIDTTNSSWFSFANIILTLYIIAFPILILTTRKMETEKPEKHTLSLGRFLLCIPLMAGLIGVGAIVGIALNTALTYPFGVPIDSNNQISIIMMNSNPAWRIITAGILAPIVEELMFRKFLIDRTYRYGEWVALLTSGLMFGLYHGNFAQFFFTGMIGAFFAFIYIRTGQIWYTIVLHSILNLSTSVITMSLMKPYLSVDLAKVNEYSNISTQILENGSDPALEQRMMDLAMEIFPKLIPFMLWLGFLGLLALAGIILWIILLSFKKFNLKKTSMYVENGTRYAWGNAGMILFFSYCMMDFILNYITIVLNARS